MFAKHKVGVKQILLKNVTMFVSFFRLKIFRKNCNIPNTLSS